MSSTSALKYIVSACLAGEKCRYDGESNTIGAIASMVNNGTAIAVCPEVMGGLSTPRVRCELNILNDGSSVITGEDGNDYTAAFTLSAQLSLDAAEKYEITKAILKSKSPSCGCGFIYDGTFTGRLIEGNGVAAELFIKSGIKVITEIEFEKLSGEF